MTYIKKFFTIASYLLIPGAILGAAYMLSGLTLPSVIMIKTDVLLSWLLILGVFMVALPFYFIGGLMCVDLVMTRLRKPPANPLQALMDQGGLQVMHLGEEPPGPSVPTGDVVRDDGGHMTGGNVL